MSYTDKTLSCRDCGTEFVFTAGEQEFFANRGFTNEPSRCSECRAARKTQRGEYTGSRETGSGGFGRSERQMHPVTCARCGIATEVPFVPRGDKPVYCSNCYSQTRSPSFS